MDKVLDLISDAEKKYPRIFHFVNRLLIVFYDKLDVPHGNSVKI